MIPRAFSSGALSIWSYAVNVAPARLRQNLRDRRRQRRLAMVDVTDRPNVAVRLRPLKLLPSPSFLLSVLAAFPCLASGQLRLDLVRDGLRHLS